MNRLSASSINISLFLVVVTFVAGIALHINGINQKNLTQQISGIALDLNKQIAGVVLDVHNLNQQISRFSEHATYQDSNPRVERSLNKDDNEKESISNNDVISKIKKEIKKENKELTKRIKKIEKDLAITKQVAVSFDACWDRICPTDSPSEVPSETPTEMPTEIPTEIPTDSPTEIPTEIPTEMPTHSLTEIPTRRPTEIPTQNPTDTLLPISVSLGYGHTCATNINCITDTNILTCWGANDYGQLGDGTTTAHSTPTLINVGDNAYPKHIALGWYHTCAITNTNALMCWGRNTYGQLGDGTTTDRNIPTKIGFGANVYPYYVTLGNYHTCAVTDTDELMCWGWNTYGQLGDGTTTHRNTPTIIDIGHNVYVKHISLGGSHTCIITNTNTLMCWGFNGFGELGDGTKTTRIIPTTIDLGENVYPTHISLGYHHTCAITNTKALMCWGWNYYGQLGDGTKTTRMVPTKIDLGANMYATHIALGGYHTCAATNTNALMCWGQNYSGELGDGTRTNRNTPTTINLGDTMYPKQISLGFGHTCAITNTDELMCWGYNGYYALGDGTTSNRYTPGLVDGIFSF